MPSDQFGRDLDEDLGYDLYLLDEDEYGYDEDINELWRMRREDIKYINGDK